MTSFLEVNGQTIEKTFSGFWADTWWTFSFYNNGTYKRLSSGHYGNTMVADNIKIIRLLNTINMSQDTSLKKGIYADFMKKIKDKDFEKDISIYYDWIPNRGMGFYFQKLQIELGGTPHLYSRYTIK